MLARQSLGLSHTVEHHGRFLQHSVTFSKSFSQFPFYSQFSPDKSKDGPPTKGSNRQNEPTATEKQTNSKRGLSS
ncbi:hypothetical protein V8C44DRAFT_327247 [Trichoderma aethiopicum]